jgi:hypothetical protein
MSKLDLDALLDANPEAAKHADSIRETLKALHELRAAGIGGDGYTLAPPYSGGANIRNAPKPSSFVTRKALQTDC